jgi:hypothetical protein
MKKWRIDDIDLNYLQFHTMTNMFFPLIHSVEKIQFEKLAKKLIKNKQ